MTIRSRLAVALVLALTVSACGGSDSAEPGDGTADTAPVGTEPSDTEPPIADSTSDNTQPATTDAEVVTTDAPAVVAPPTGTLRHAHIPAVATWDPHQESRAVLMSYFDTVYDSLLRYDEDLVIQPGLATDWELSTDELRLTLREGVMFHDGTPFDADAAVFNLERAKATPGESAQTLAKVTAITAVDATTVVLELDQPAPELLYGLTRMPGLMVSPVAADAGTLGTTPVGTGPYAFVASESDDVRSVFEAFDGFYAPELQGFERVEHLALIDGAARLNAFTAGDTDITYLAGRESSAYEAAGAELIQFPQTASGLYFFDQGPGGLFEDVRVRQAISHAIDRETLAEVVGPARPNTSRYFEGEYGYNPDATGFPYDPGRAQELLSDAGAEGLEFSVPSFAAFDASNQVVQGMLAAVGITMNIEQVPFGRLEVECTSGAWAACLMQIDNLHPAELYRTSIAPDGLRNPNSIVHPAAEAAASAALQEPDPDTAADLWAEFTLATTVDLAWTDLGLTLGTIGYNPDLFDNGVEPIPFVAGSVQVRGLRFAEG